MVFVELARRRTHLLTPERITVLRTDTLLEFSEPEDEAGRAPGAHVAGTLAMLSSRVNQGPALTVTRMRPLGWLRVASVAPATESLLAELRAVLELGCRWLDVRLSDDDVPPGPPG